MSSIVPLSRGDSISRIGDVQQSIRENLFGAFDVTKLQAAFDILFGIISVQQTEIDKLNKEVLPIKEKQNSMERTIQYNDNEQQATIADHSLVLSKMAKQIESLKRNLSDVVKSTDGDDDKDIAAALEDLNNLPDLQLPERSKLSDTDQMESSIAFPLDLDNQDKNPLSPSNEPSELHDSNLHELSDSRSISPENSEKIQENLQEFTDDIAKYYDSITTHISEDDEENLLDSDQIKDMIRHQSSNLNDINAESPCDSVSGSR